MSTWEFVDRKNAIGVVDLIALTECGKIILVEQFRQPFDCRVIELPAGLMGDSDEHSAESPVCAAHRELWEETGYRAASMMQVARGGSSPGHTTEMVNFVLATGLKKVSRGGGVGDEDIVVHAVPLAHVDDWLHQQGSTGKVVGARVYAGLHFARLHYVSM